MSFEYSAVASKRTEKKAAKGSKKVKKATKEKLTEVFFSSMHGCVKCVSANAFFDTLSSADAGNIKAQDGEPPRKRVKIRVSSASKSSHPELDGVPPWSIGLARPSVHRDGMHQAIWARAHFLARPFPLNFTQVELMLYAFDGSPSLDKITHLCPGTSNIRAFTSCEKT